ncbi:Transmembrane protein 42 [Escovopsis weberi]|uniref:Transmembrane protein 42 n=1 Tax=Escovopsis weberi TaxID=150374 RepID=A0A0M8MYU1_ESCWE|nr:Transmembrane protein 42 [Escovopsis weberi]
MQRLEHLGDAASKKQRAWLVYAVGSGMCAAFNGVFAKLTTTQLTGELSVAIADALSLGHHEHIIQLLCRAIFFALNLAFNGIMWTLFTTALTKSSSATQVAVLNSSSNFLITALAGMLIFSEALPPMWWAGAALLVAGSVVAGRRDREADKGDAAAAPAPADIQVDELRADSSAPYRDNDGDDDDVPDLGRL